MHLAAIFRHPHPPQPRLLEAKLLFDHPEAMLHFGADVSLLQAEACGYGYFDQIEQSPV
jgi:hypothetical protein